MNKHWITFPLSTISYAAGFSAKILSKTWMTKVNRARLFQIEVNHNNWETEQECCTTLTKNDSWKKLEKQHSILLNGLQENPYDLIQFFQNNIFRTNSYIVFFLLLLPSFRVFYKHLEHTDHMHTWETWLMKKHTHTHKIQFDALSVRLAVCLFIPCFPSPPSMCSLPLFIGFR